LVGIVQLNDLVVNNKYGYWTLIHEVIHILAFSPSQVFPLDLLKISKSKNWENYLVVKSELLLKYVSDHFNCATTFILIEKENESVSLVHLAYMMFESELMTPFPVQFPSLSEFTFNVIEATMFFKVNRQFNIPLVWQYKAGCDFFKILKSKNQNSFYDVYSGLCNVQGEYGCSSNFLSKGICDSHSYTHGMLKYIGLQNDSCYDIDSDNPKYCLRTYNNVMSSDCFKVKISDDLKSLLINKDDQWVKCTNKKDRIMLKDTILICPPFDRFLLSFNSRETRTLIHYYFK